MRFNKRSKSWLLFIIIINVLYVFLHSVRIHMFNLYQSGSITREMINTEQLGKCKLAFWLCILEDGVYSPVSPQSLSRLIEEDYAT